MRKAKIAILAVSLMLLLCFSGCNSFVPEDEQYYFKTKAGSADTIWNASVEIPDELDCYRIGRNNTSDYWDDVLSLYDFPAHYNYENGANYEKDGVSIAVKEDGSIKITLPQKQNPYNTLLGSELTEKAKEHFDNIGIKLTASSYLWGFYEEGEKKGDIYISEIIFSQCTAEGYQIYSDAARVSFRDNDVYEIEFSVNEIASTKEAKCITSQSVCDKFKNIDLYTGKKIPNVKSVTVDSAEITYAPKEENSNELIPFISFEGTVSDGSVTIEYESAGIPLC